VNKFHLKGSIGHAFAVLINTENKNKANLSPFSPHEISILIEFTLEHLRYILTDVPPQPNSQPNHVFLEMIYPTPKTNMVCLKK